MDEYNKKPAFYKPETIDDIASYGDQLGRILNDQEESCKQKVKIGNHSDHKQDPASLTKKKGKYHNSKLDAGNSDCRSEKPLQKQLNSRQREDASM